MILSDVMAIVFSVLGMILAFQGLWLLCRCVWPNAVSAACAECERSLWKPFWVGLPIAAVAFVAATHLGKLGSLGGAGAVLTFAIFVFFSCVGVSGLACLLGNRLRGLPNNGDCSTSSIIRGGIVLELSFVFPLAGWFFLLPVTLIIGAGASTLSLVSMGKRTPAAPRAVTPSEQPVG